MFTPRRPSRAMAALLLLDASSDTTRRRALPWPAVSRRGHGHDFGYGTLVVETLGVLVAGGSGSRLGLGVPKAMASVGGVTLLERGVGTLSGLCDQIVVSAPAKLRLQMPAVAGAPL